MDAGRVLGGSRLVGWSEIVCSDAVDAGGGAEAPGEEALALGRSASGLWLWSTA